MTITLIRHGKTKSNETLCYLGITDEGLSEAGIEQIYRKKCQNYYPDVDEVYISPMLRCRQTADIIYPDIDKKTVCDFREINFGIFEGKNHEMLNGNKEYQAWVDSRCEKKIPKGESKSEFIGRTMNAWHQLTNILGDEILTDRRLALIVHGGTIKTLLSSLLGGDYFSYDIKNSEKIEIKFDVINRCWIKSGYLEG